MIKLCGRAFQVEGTVSIKALRQKHAQGNCKETSMSRVYKTVRRVEQNEIKRNSREPESWSFVRR